MGISNTTLWLIVLAVSVVLELVTQQLISIWFVVGSAAAIILSFWDTSLVSQFVLFLVLSLVALILTRPFVKKFLQKDKTKTNADMVIGKSATVVESIPCGESGRVSCNGLDWKAEFEDQSQSASVGERLIVKKIEGVTLIVSKN